MVVATTSISFIASIVAILLNYFTGDTRWLFGDVIIGFIFLLASGLSLGTNAGDGGGSIFMRKQFQEMYKDQPGKIPKLNRQAGKASVICLCIGLPNFLLPIIVAVVQHNY